MKACLPLLLILAASGCASTSPQKPPVCDGKHRRPANPYGSVLPVALLEGQTGGFALVPSPPPAPSVAPASASRIPPDQMSSAQPPSAKPDPRSIRSCGGKS